MDKDLEDKILKSISESQKQYLAGTYTRNMMQDPQLLALRAEKAAKKKAARLAKKERKRRRLGQNRNSPYVKELYGENKKYNNNISYYTSDAFLQSYEWRKIRMEILKKYGARCQCCGATPADGVRINVDHIKPRKTHPELALTESNLQVLCEECNHGKGNWDSTDWRFMWTKTDKTR